MTKICKTCGEEYFGRGKYFCSQICASRDPERIKKFVEKVSKRKQSKEHIQKRIQNTDQKSKEEKRKKTMIDKYGVSNWGETDEARSALSDRMSGSKRARSDDHQRKIIESKRRNGTLKHTEKTKEKIKEKVVQYLNSDRYNPENHISKSPSKHEHGYIGSLYYRSSYEKQFINFCINFGLAIETAECNKFSVKYHDKNGNERTYFPDFYLKDFDIVVEIKPKSMIYLNDNEIKISSAKDTLPRYIVLTEEHGYLNELTWCNLMRTIQKIL